MMSEADLLSIPQAEVFQAARPLDRDAVSDPLLVACRIVARAAGITVQHPVHSSAVQPQAVSLAAIAQASSFRTRTVILKAEWWLHNHGPLLAYRQEDQQPLALLPDGPRRYNLIDPVSGSSIRVTADVADTLASFAVLLYRPLPARSLSASALLAFGLHSWHREARPLLLLGLATATMTSLLPPGANWLFDVLIVTQQFYTFVLFGAALVVGVLLAALLHLAAQTKRLELETRLAATMDAALWDRMLNQPTRFFRSFSAADLYERSRSLPLIWQLSIRSGLSGVFAAIVGCCSLLVLLSYAPTLALISLGIVASFVSVALLLNIIQMRRQNVVQTWAGIASGLIFQFVAGLAAFRVAGAEQRAFAHWLSAFRKQQMAANRASMIDIALVVWMALMPLLAVAVMIGAMLGGAMPAVSTGRFLGLLIAFTQLLLAGVILSHAVNGFLQVRSYYQQALPILQTVPEVNPALAPAGDLSGAIEVKHVSFGYTGDGPKILHDVSLQIDPGEFVAIVGPSGSGKSTLLRLLMGFERPDAGMIAYDGQDLATLDVRSVRRQIGVVLQHGTLMANDLFHNIIGSSLLTVEDAWEAARMVGIDAEIEEMPMGMHTMVPEGGHTFSGGQRQRILIARAIVHKPRILFLDEATSALDNVAQATVSASLERLRVTRVVIAHRLSTIANADRVVVLDRGKIVESGTFAELIQQNGLFARMARRQMV